MNIQFFFKNFSAALLASILIFLDGISLRVNPTISLYFACGCAVFMLGVSFAYQAVHRSVPHFLKEKVYILSGLMLLGGIILVFILESLGKYYRETAVIITVLLLAQLLFSRTKKRKFKRY